MVDAVSSPVVAVTGSAGYIGTRLLQQLEDADRVAKLVAIDVKPLAMPFHNIDAYRLDITQPIDAVFHDHRVSTVVHLAFDMRPGRNAQEAQAIHRNNVQGLENLLRACRAGKVANLVYLSSHTVYGAYADNPVPIPEEAALRPLPGFQYSQTKIECEVLLRRFAQENPSTGITVLRSSMVMGPGGIGYVARGFQKPFLIRVLGHDPPLQFTHEQDLARLLAQFSLEPRPGVFNVAGEGVVHYSRLAKILEKRLVALPPVIAYPLVQLAWKLGFQTDAPAVGLDLVRYPMVLSTEKLRRETYFQFYYTAEEAVSSYVASN